MARISQLEVRVSVSTQACGEEAGELIIPARNLKRDDERSLGCQGEN